MIFIFSMRKYNNNNGKVMLTLSLADESLPVLFSPTSWINYKIKIHSMKQQQSHNEFQLNSIRKCICILGGMEENETVSLHLCISQCWETIAFLFQNGILTNQWKNETALIFLILHTWFGMWAHFNPDSASTKRRCLA